MTGKLKHPVSHGGASGGDEALQRAMIALNSGHPADAERIAADVLKTNRRNVTGAAGFGQRAVDAEQDCRRHCAARSGGARQSRSADRNHARHRAAPGRPDRGRVVVAQARGQAAAAACSGVLRVRLPAVVPQSRRRGGRGVQSRPRRRAADAAALGPARLRAAPAQTLCGGQDRVRPRVSQCRGLSRGSVRLGQSPSGGRRQRGGGRIFPAVPDEPAQRRGYVAAARLLSVGARRSRGRSRVLPHRHAWRPAELRQCAVGPGEVGPRPVLAQAERGRAIFPAGQKASAATAGSGGDRRWSRAGAGRGFHSSARLRRPTSPRIRRSSFRALPAGTGPPACPSAARR